MYSLLIHPFAFFAGKKKFKFSAHCTHDFSNGGSYYFKISSKKRGSKEIQVIINSFFKIRNTFFVVFDWFKKIYLLADNSVECCGLELCEVPLPPSGP